MPFLVTNLPRGDINLTQARNVPAVAETGAGWAKSNIDGGQMTSGARAGKSRLRDGVAPEQANAPSGRSSNPK